MGKKGIGKAFLVIIAVGFGLIGLSFLETPFPDIIPLTILQQTIFCPPDQVECRIAFVGSAGFFQDGQAPINILPLSEIDTLSPMIVNFEAEPIRTATNTFFNVPPECESFVTEDVIMNLKDENDNVLHVIPEGITDIQPFIQQGQQTLILETVAGVCQPNFDDGIRSIRYFMNGVQDPVFGTGQATFIFSQKPPEIIEFSNTLLAQHNFLSDYRDQAVVEKAQRFAVAESFQLVDPTVITDLKIRMGSDLRQSERDLDTQITAFVWNLDETPPKRIVQSTETFKGITSDIDLEFTFQNAVVLLAVENDQQITYGVGFRVDQNIGQEFVYTQSNQTADTHECVIDRNSASDSESMFVSNGLCGFDIKHSQFKASQILQALPDLNDPNILTRPELVALLCEGISPEPIICQGINTARPTADQCGVTEIFFNGQCLCAPTFDRNAQGDCVITETDLLPDLLQIGQFSLQLLVIIGVIIIVLGIIGIVVKSRR